VKTFMVVVSGNQIVSVDAQSEDEASDAAYDYMSDNSALRDWEIGWIEEMTERYDKGDFDIRIGERRDTMQEQYVQVEIAELRDVSTQLKCRQVDEQQQHVLSEPQKVPFDFTHIDFSQPEIRASLGRAYRVLLEHAQRRIQTTEE
jgi:hypothetical protein